MFNYTKKLLLIMTLMAASYHGFALEVGGQLKKAQLEKLSADPTGTEARIYYNETEKKAKIHNGTAWSSVGSGGGGINYITQFDAESGISQWLQYDNDAAIPSVSGTGTITFATNSTDPLRETKDLKFSAGASDIGEGVYTTFTVEYTDIGKTLHIGFEYRTNSDYVDGNMGVYIHSTTAGYIKIGDILKDDTSPYAKFAGYYNVRADEAHALFIHTQGTPSAQIDLYFDTVKVSPDPFNNVQVVEQQTIRISQAQNAMTDITNEIRFNLATATLSSSLAGQLFTVSDDSTGARTKITFAKKATVTLNVKGTFNSVGWAPTVYLNGVAIPTPSTTNSTGGGGIAHGSLNIEVVAGDYLSIYTSTILSNNADAFVLTLSATSTSEHVTQSYESGTEWTAYTPTGSWTANTTYAGFWKREGSDMLLDISVSTSGAPTSTGLTDIYIPSGYTIDFAKLTGGVGVGYSGILGGGNVYDLTGSIYPVTIRAQSTTSLRPVYIDGSSIHAAITQAAPMTFATGDKIVIQARIPIAGWSSAPKLLSLPVSKENVFSARITSAGVITSQSADWIASVTKSTGTYTINFKAGLFTVAPSVVAIPEVTLTGSVIPRFSINSVTASSVTFYHSNNDNFGNAGFAFSDIPFDVHVQKQGADYTPPGVYVGNVSKTPVAILSEVQTSGTNGGTFTSGAWQTRALNTVTGDSHIVSLSANVFTLQAGEYLVEVEAPALGVNNHKAGIALSASSTPEIVGVSSYAGVADSTTILATVSEKITITSTTSYKIVHRCGTTGSGNGFGANSGLGVSEVYTTVKITQLAKY